jgi:hypothetical protein
MIQVPFMKEPGPSPVPDHPADFPPGSPGSIPPADPPPHIMRKLHEIDPRYRVAYHPYLHMHTIWILMGGTEYKLVTPVWDPFTKVPIRLDERIVALLIDSEPRYQGGSKKIGQQAEKWGRARTAARWRRTRELVKEKRVTINQRQRIWVGYGRNRDTISKTL